MTTLKAEKRDMKVKAKALRREGKVLGNIFGRDISESIPITMNEVEAGRFLKEHTKGSQAVIDLDGKQISVQLKEVSYEPMKHQYDNVDFQMLVEGEKVTSTAQIILLNTDKVRGFITHTLSELTYKAMPSALVEKIEIDAAQVPVDTNLLAGDLDFAKNKAIDLVTPADTVILHIAAHQKAVVEEEEAEAAETAATEA